MQYRFFIIPQQEDAQDCEITFLPLPPTFDYTRSDSWADLALQIQDWLINIVADTRAQQWIWGREIFWIAFMAAYPNFPQGPWLKWDSKISMDGSFIQGWMDKLGSNPESDGTDDEDALMEELWQEFYRVVSLCYPYRLIDDA